MDKFPPTSEIEHLIGETLQLVYFGPFSVTFQFEQSTITSEHTVEHIEPDGTAWNFIVGAAQAPATKLHRLVGKRICSLTSADFRLNLTFEDGAQLAILSVLGPYESGQIGGCGKYIVF